MLNVSDQEIQFFKNDVTHFSELESQIKEDPSQYFWTHNRFKHLIS